MDTRSPRLFVRSTSLILIFMLVVALALPALPALAQSTATLTVASGLFVAPEGTVTIPVTLASSPPASVISIEAVVTYDSTKLDLVSAGTGAATAGWLGIINDETAGTVLFAFAVADPPIASGEVAVITLKAKAGKTGPVQIGISDILINEQPATGVAGSVRINTAPVAAADGYTISENGVLTVNAPGVLGNDSDLPDNEAITAQLDTSVAHGALTLNGNGSFTYTPTPTYNGPDSFTYRAVDPWGVSSNLATVSITVGAVNDPPIANAGGNRSVNEGASITLNGSATDIDNAPGSLIYTWDLDNNGTFETSGADVTFSAATRDGPGTQPVVLRVSDGTDFDTDDSATITINNVAPTAVAGGPYAVDEGGTIPLDGSNSSDPAGPMLDPLTYAWDYDDGGSTADGTGVAPTLTALAGSGPANRTVTLTVDDGDGGTHSATAALTVRDVVALTLPALEEQWASTVVIPVTMSGLNSSLQSINLTFNYPSSLLTFVSAAGAGLTNGWTATPTPGSGNVQVQLTGSTALGASSGEVMRLTFTSGGASGSGALSLSNVIVNGGTVSNAPTPGSIRLLSRYSVGGTVKYWMDARPITGATLTLTGLDAGSTTSAGGAYNWAQIYEGSHTLTPSKGDQVNGITAYDAALALKEAVHMQPPLTGDALVAADVTGENGVTSHDAALILQKSVRLINMGPFPATGDIWRFTPPSASFSLAGNKAQDFTALLMGDISGNWNPAGATVAAWPASVEAVAAAQPLPLMLTVERTSATTALLTIAFVDAPPDTLALNMEIHLSSAATLQKATPAQNAMVAWSAPDAQSLSVGVAATRAMQSGPVATLEVALPADAPLHADVVALTINERAVLVPSRALFLPLVDR